MDVIGAAVVLSRMIDDLGPEETPKELAESISANTPTNYGYQYDGHVLRPRSEEIETGPTAEGLHAWTEVEPAAQEANSATRREVA